MKKDIETFIKEHTHVNYCEVIIHRDGKIEYVNPSHVNTLIRITGEDEFVLWKKMPRTEMPIEWLVNYTGCIAVYTQGFIKPTKKKLTISQQISLHKLIEAELTELYSIL